MIVGQRIIYYVTNSDCSCTGIVSGVKTQPTGMGGSDYAVTNTAQILEVENGIVSTCFPDGKNQSSRKQALDPEVSRPGFYRIEYSNEYKLCAVLCCPRQDKNKVEIKLYRFLTE